MAFLPWRQQITFPLAVFGSGKNTQWKRNQAGHGFASPFSEAFTVQLKVVYLVCPGREINSPEIPCALYLDATR